LFVIEAALVIADRNNSFENLVNVENLPRKIDVFVDALVDRLFISYQQTGKTIPNLPSIIAISPPVLVPPIRSKYSQGRGVSLVSDRLLISSITSRNIKSEDKPRTPPPSRDRILGQCLSPK